MNFLLPAQITIANALKAIKQKAYDDYMSALEAL